MASNRIYRVRGDVQEIAAPQTRQVGISAPRRLTPGSGRQRGGAICDLAADELVRVTLANGFSLWTRADDLLRERGRAAQARGGETAWDLELGPPARAGGGTRGALGLGIQTLEVFGVDLKGMTARALGEWLEGHQLGREPGLYACTLDDPFALVPATAIPEGPGPCLVFLHGTGSSCQGSFGALWAADNKAGRAARAALKARYGTRVYAFEHRSLTQSPLVNARDLARLLPAGAELHLVSHSRGGMLGELLCLAERDRDRDPLRPDLIRALFDADRTVAPQLGLSPLDPQAAKGLGQAYGEDRKALVELRDLLDQSKPKVSRFVRVACPARGTTLASGRLDRWLSVLGYLGVPELLGDALDFLLAVVKERTDPRTLPGLEAMMPGSALTRLLNHPDLVTTADLSVIAGDAEGDSTWGQIKLLAADWFYGADHDLVVNTGSMLGGLRRPRGGARFRRHQGPTVTHFNYFRNELSLGWLTAALTRLDGADAGFGPIETAPHEAPLRRGAQRPGRGSGRPRPLAVVLPGTMGSALSADGRDVWLDYWALMRGELGRLRRDQGAQVRATGLLDSFYGPLIDFLAASHRVEVFPYDWRLSVRDAAAELTRQLETWLPAVEPSAQPVHLVAHSMGGLVVRAMIADGGAGAAVWRRILALPESRLLMLGTPNQGSWEALRWLTGTNPTLAKLSLLDLTRGSDGIVDLVRDFPGLLELLPCDADAPDLARAQFWRDLKADLGAAWSTAAAAALRQTRDTWTLLRRTLPDPRVLVYVAGCQPVTVAGYELTPYEESHLAGRKRLGFRATAAGDGTVTWASGALPGVPVWYLADTAHDALCTSKAAFPAYLDLLATGTTSRLPQTPPARSRDAAALGATFPLPAAPPLDDIPDPAAVAALGFGPGLPPGEGMDEPAAPVIQIGVRHGNLAYARHPVLVGHYQGDVLVNAERSLDEHLGGALAKGLVLGLYPGRAGTQALYLNPSPSGRPGGAVVIGLGQVGELSPGVIEAGVRDALLAYALRIEACPDARFGDPQGVRSAALTCLLVGSGAGGLTVFDSVDAILRGALAAADRLAEADLDRRVVVDRLEFLELHLDIAIAAAEALDEALRDGKLAGRFAWPGRTLEEGEGGLRRLRGDGPSGWWQRLEIIEETPADVLRFIASTDRARAEVTLASGQLRLADAFIAQACQSERTNTEVSKTLFEMLLPNRLRELSQRQDDLVVLVDETSARFPWELLEDRWSHNGRPPAVAAGLVRQLKAQDFRPHPAHAVAPRALVVGNPDLGGWPDFADLRGAREEAERVAQVLRERGYRVLDIIDQGPDVILNGLHKDAWRILHLAGHGVHDYPLPGPAGSRPLSGMVIGRDTLLTPGDIGQMRWVPELVFINCCHLGKTGPKVAPQHNRLAANLAVEFIRMGVKAVVAAGWAVDDAAARAFAETFYAHLLDGVPFGAAVRAAREEVWTRFPDVNTWGAYQCYGDPSFRLRGDGCLPLSPLARRYYAPGQLVADLYNHTESVRMQIRNRGDDPEALAALRQGIDDLFAAIPDDRREVWLARADVAAAVGLAWGETRAYAEAVNWLDKALRADTGDCSLRALEQRNAFRVRLAGEQWQALRGQPEGPDKEGRRQALVEQIDEAINELAAVCRRAATVERLTLLGNACRRLAWLDTGARGRLEALANMAAYYRQALDKVAEGTGATGAETGAEMGQGGADRGDAAGLAAQRYPHWVAARVLAAGLDATLDGDWRADLAAGCRRMGALAAARNAEQPSFRLAVAVADNATAQLLTTPVGEAPPAEAEAEVTGLYRAAFQGGASPGEIAAVLEGLDFLIDLGSLLPGPVATALANIRQAL